MNEQQAKALYDKMLKENSGTGTIEMMVEFANQARQDERTKVLNEVIEKLRIKIDLVEENNRDTGELKSFKFSVQSMLLKEEVKQPIQDEVSKIRHNAKTVLEEFQDDEIKAGEMVEARIRDVFKDGWEKETYYFTGGIAKSGLFICQDKDDKIKFFTKIGKPTKRPSLVEAERLVAENFTVWQHKDYDVITEIGYITLIEFTEKILLKNKE